jgi:mono/diheme cytochrome c family protein
VAKAIQDGLGVMPGFRDKLSAQEIALLARYVAQATAAPR